MNSYTRQQATDKTDKRALRKALERLHREYQIAVEWNQAPNKLSAIKREYDAIAKELRGLA